MDVVISLIGMPRIYLPLASLTPYPVFIMFLTSKRLIEEEKKRVAAEKRKEKAEEKRRLAESERQQTVGKGGVIETSPKEAKGKDSASALEDHLSPNSSVRKRTPGSSGRKSSTPASAAAPVAPGTTAATADGAPAAPPKKRGRGRPRKDGSDPIPRKPVEKPAPRVEELYDVSDAWTSEQRSRSGRKIQRTTFHDEVGGIGLRLREAKRARTEALEEEQAAAAASSAAAAAASVQDDSARTTPRRSTAEEPKAAGRNSLPSAAGTPGFAAVADAASGKITRRKPGARECMQISRKFGSGVIDQRYFDILMVSFPFTYIFTLTTFYTASHDQNIFFASFVCAIAGLRLARKS